jgi:hypothetical protein
MISGVDLDRRRIRGLVDKASASEDRVRRLAEVPPDALVAAVLDAREPWWRQMNCARALAGRVPPGRVTQLLDIVRDQRVTTEVRVALLDVLTATAGSHRAALLAWIREQESVEQPYQMPEALLRARAELGDLDAAGPLMALATSPWKHEQEIGAQGLETLVTAHGKDTLLAALGADSMPALAFAGTSEAHRLFGVRVLRAEGGDVTPALADPSDAVARTAYELLAGEPGDEQALLDLVENYEPGHLWALAVLHSRGHAIRDAWESLGPPLIELPGLPADVRQAIVRTYTPGERQTDPRWLLEAACLGPATGPGEDELLRRAARALTGAGLRPQAPVSAGRLSGSGEGTYHAFETRLGEVLVSTLGPFFAHEGDPRVLAVMTEAGFRRISGGLADTRVDGLHVYFFGAREPLTVRDLLFYWQD